MNTRSRLLAGVSALALMTGLSACDSFQKDDNTSNDTSLQNLDNAQDNLDNAQEDLTDAAENATAENTTAE